MTLLALGAAIRQARGVISLEAFLQAFNVQGPNPQDQFNLLENAIDGDRQHQLACLAYSCAIVYKFKKLRAQPVLIQTYVDDFRNAYRRAGELRGCPGDVWKNLMKVAKELHWFTIEYYKLFNFSSSETTMELAELFLEAPATVEAFGSFAEVVREAGSLFGDWNLSVVEGTTVGADQLHLAIAIAKEEKEKAMHEAEVKKHEAEWKKHQAEVKKYEAEWKKHEAETKKHEAEWKKREAEAKKHEAEADKWRLFNEHYRERAHKLEYATAMIQSGLSKDDVLSVMAFLSSPDRERASQPVVQGSSL